MDDDEAGTVDAIGDDVRAELCSMGVRPGKHLVVQTRQPFGGPITVSVGRTLASLSPVHARHVHVDVDE